MRIDLGSAGAAQLIGDGWSEPLSDDPDGPGWRWAPAPAATVRLALPTPADRRLTVTARRPESLASQRLEIWLNGFKVSDYTEAEENIPRSGRIGLQIHSGAPSECWYKDIELKSL